MTLSRRATSLAEAVADPNRRRAESRIRSPRDIEVFVEGWGDMVFLKRNYRESRQRDITFKHAERNGGKEWVIQTVKGSENKLKYGIVDMDHDIDSKCVEGCERLVDTSEKCCLFSYVVDEEHLLDFVISLVRYIHLELKREYAHPVDEIIQNLNRHESTIKERLKERTKARLWRGDAGTRGRIKERGARPGWTAFMFNENGNISDLVQSGTARKNFEIFCKISLFNKKPGVNDHDLEDLVMIMFEEFYKPYKKAEREVEKSLRKGMVSLMIEWKDSRRKAKEILDKLHI